MKSRPTAKPRHNGAALPHVPPHGLDRLYAPQDRPGTSSQIDVAPRVLIVEDDFLVATEVEAALHDAGFVVTGVAATSEEALALAQMDRPFLAVMDIRLAGERDGIDTAVTLFQDHGIRCIFATAHSDEQVRRRAHAARPLGWLQKPYSMRSLVALIRQASQQTDLSH